MADEALALRAMKKIKTLQAEIAEREEAVEHLKGVVAANLPLGETLLQDPDDEDLTLKATVYVSKTFNENYGKKNRPDLWEKAAISTRVLTSAAAKSAFGEDSDEYRAFQKPSDKTSVKVEVLND